MPAMQKSLQNIVLILLGLFLFSCKNKTNLYIEKVELPEQLADVPDSLRKIQALDQLVVEITKLERLEGKYVGYAGLPSTQRDYSQELLKLADTNYLLRLTSHRNPIVRVISFEVLVAKGFFTIKNVFKDHIEDNETYLSYGGCLITPMPVNLRMYNTIKDQLTSEEKAHFGKLIIEQLRKYKYWDLYILEATI